MDHYAVLELANYTGISRKDAQKVIKICRTALEQVRHDLEVSEEDAKTKEDS